MPAATVPKAKLRTRAQPSIILTQNHILIFVYPIEPDPYLMLRLPAPDAPQWHW
jgi:hypothetical protein